MTQKAGITAQRWREIRIGRHFPRLGISPLCVSPEQGTLLIGTPFVPYLAYPAQACRQGALPELTNAHSLTRIILTFLIVRELV